MDDFSWGNTRIVVGEGKDKKVVYQDDEGFDESVIPLKKFSEYEAETLEMPDHHSISGESRAPSQPRSRAASRAPAPSFHGHSRQGSTAGSGFNSPSGGDYWRDTNLTHNNSSNPNLRLPPIGPLASLNASAHGHQSSVGHTGMIPPMGFGSDHGHNMGGAGEFGGMMPGFGYAGSAYGGSAYGGAAPGVPRNSVMTNLNMFGGQGGAMPMGGMGFGTMSSAGRSVGPGGSVFGSMGPAGTGGFGIQQRPMSSFSMATSVNPFMNAPSQSTNPTEEELLSVLRIYLSTQDLMTVTKKTAREAVMARFPKADLSSKKEFLNQSIERILSET